MNFAMATLGLKEMGKFLWEGREKSLPSWLSQFSFAKKSGIMKSGLDAMPLFLLDDLLINWQTKKTWLLSPDKNGGLEM